MIFGDYCWGDELLRMDGAQRDDGLRVDLDHVDGVCGGLFCVFYQSSLLHILGF